MTIQDIYSKCCRYKGRAVYIRTQDGRIHHGIINHVTKNKVYIMPLSRSGFGYGWGFGWGGFAYGIALGLITSIALASFFFW